MPASDAFLSKLQLFKDSCSVLTIVLDETIDSLIYILLGIVVVKKGLEEEGVVGNTMNAIKQTLNLACWLFQHLILYKVSK